MATVVQTIDGEDTVYTISSIYPQITINSLFSFISYNGYFRISRDNGSTWSTLELLTEENLRAIEVDIESDLVVAQFRFTLAEMLLAINDTGDLLDINDDGDNLRIT
jgi:hypothetical protein